MSVATADHSDLVARRGAGVAWMNRGHALMQAGQVAAALAAYEEAITLLRPLAAATRPAWSNSLGAALMNRGALLHRVHGTSRADEAFAAFDEAAGLLRPLATDNKHPWPRRNLAGTLLNRANLLLDLRRHAGARNAAREALGLAQPWEHRDVVDADVALKSRRALCDALGQLIVMPGAAQDELAAEASDLVDDGLALIRHWSGQDRAGFQPLAHRFFRYGVQLYRFHQPHFLAEFIQENRPLADPALRAIAIEVIDATLNDRPPAGSFLTVGDPATERRRRTWTELAALRQRLAA